MTPPRIGGAPVVTLRANPQPGQPSFVEATVLPGRGFMLLQLIVQMPDGRRMEVLTSPDLAAAAEALGGGTEDFEGNRSFTFGGAILAPYANRIRGRPRDGTREIDALIDNRPTRLPANWGADAPGSEPYAMHGLILATPVAWSQVADNHVSGRLGATDFGGRWPGRADLEFNWRLDSGRLELRVGVTARGRQSLPVGIGWHPYFRTSPGGRRDVELTLPARARVEVCDYVDVFPTGRLLPVEHTAYDFTNGRPLGDLNLDDCFTDLLIQRGRALAELRDPAIELGLRIASTAPPVRAIQVYAPTAQDFVAIEPQFNLADPYSPVWDRDIDTGMLRLSPGQRTTYEVTVSPFALGGSTR